MTNTKNYFKDCREVKWNMKNHSQSNIVNGKHKAKAHKPHSAI